MLSQTRGRYLQKGIGLLELMLSLAIISALLVMATRYYETAYREQRVNEAMSMAKALRAASAHWVVGKHNYRGLSLQSLQDYGLLPKAIAGANPSQPGQGVNPWGGDIQLTATSSQKQQQGYQDQVQITFSNVPYPSCSNIQGKLANEADKVTCSQGDRQMIITMD